MSLHLKLLDIDHPLTFEKNKLRQIEAHALIYLRSTYPDDQWYASFRVSKNTFQFLLLTHM